MPTIMTRLVVGEIIAGGFIVEHRGKGLYVVLNATIAI